MHYNQYIPGIKQYCNEIGVKCTELFGSRNLLIEKDEHRDTISFEIIEDCIHSGNFGMVLCKVDNLVNLTKPNLKQFNWPYVPEWKKRKEILFRRFNG